VKSIWRNMFLIERALQRLPQVVTPRSAETVRHMRETGQRGWDEPVKRAVTRQEYGIWLKHGASALAKHVNGRLGRASAPCAIEAPAVRVREAYTHPVTGRVSTRQPAAHNVPVRNTAPKSYGI
jgi:hypothetical protein